MPGRDGRARLLILGGTTEAANLAEATCARFGDRLAVITSLAGRTRHPAAVAGALRVGGFGGAAALAIWLGAENIAMVVDATHPYAERISANARRACATAGVARLIYMRPPWTAGPDDRWRCVPDLDSAATLLPHIAKRALLTVGSKRLEAFAGLHRVHLVVRMIDPPPGPLPLADYTVALGRGPFDETTETALLRREKIDAVVSRNSGGTATIAKIRAARNLGTPVVMVEDRKSVV